MFDHLLQRNEKVSRALRGEKAGGGKLEGEGEGAEGEPSTTEEQTPDSQSGEAAGEGAAGDSLEATVKELNCRLQQENSKLHQVNTSLHEVNRSLKLEVADLSEQLGAQTTSTEELENKWEDASYELGKTKSRNDKLETMLLETQAELQLHVAANAGKEIKVLRKYCK